MASFCKNEDCPPSQDLLAFLNGDVPLNEGKDIRQHLSICEFCSAEVDFYKRYPQIDEPAEIRSPEIPKPLFELAEALIGRKRNAGSLETLFGDKTAKD